MGEGLILRDQALPYGFSPAIVHTKEDPSVSSIRDQRIAQAKAEIARQQAIIDQESTRNSYLTDFEKKMMELLEATLPCLDDNCSYDLSGEIKAALHEFDEMAKARSLAAISRLTP